MRSAYEKETIVNYNQEEDTASCYTANPALMRRLDKLAEQDANISILKEGDDWKEYLFPKKWVKIRPPRSMSEEQRLAAADRMKQMREEKKQLSDGGA